MLMGVGFKQFGWLSKRGAFADTPRDAPSLFSCPGASKHHHLIGDVVCCIPCSSGITPSQSMPCRNSVHHGRNARCLRGG